MRRALGWLKDEIDWHLGEAGGISHLAGPTAGYRGRCTCALGHAVKQPGETQPSRCAYHSATH